MDGAVCVCVCAAARQRELYVCVQLIDRGSCACAAGRQASLLYMWSCNCTISTFLHRTAAVSEQEWGFMLASGPDSKKGKFDMN